MERHIERIINDLLNWKNTPGHLPVVVVGPDWIGKTLPVRLFVQKNYENVVYVSLAKQPECVRALRDAQDVETVIASLTALDQGASFSPVGTCLFFDDIQVCPERYDREGGSRLRIYPVSIKPEADLPANMGNRFHFGSLR